MMVSKGVTFVIENTCALVAEAAAFFVVDLASLAYLLAKGYFFAEIKQLFLTSFPRLIQVARISSF